MSDQDFLQHGRLVGKRKRQCAAPATDCANSSTGSTSITPAEQDRYITIAQHCEYLTTNDGVKLWYRRYYNPSNEDVNGVIIVVHSFGEHCAHYEHVAKRFYNANYCVVSYDQRGYGQSSGKRGHLESMERAIQDLKQIIEIAWPRTDVKPVYLYGHASGAMLCIWYEILSSSSHSTAVVAAASPANSTTFTNTKWMTFPKISGIIAQAPYFRLTVPIPKWQSGVISLLSKVSSGYTVELFAEPEKLTSDPEMQEMYREDRSRCKEISVKHLLEFESYGTKCMEQAHLVKTPVLLLHGTEDLITDHKASVEFMAKCGSSEKEIVLLKGMLHDLHNELNREKFVFRKILLWLDEIQTKQALSKEKNCTLSTCKESLSKALETELEIEDQLFERFELEDDLELEDCSQKTKN